MSPPTPSRPRWRPWPTSCGPISRRRSADRSWGGAFLAHALALHLGLRFYFSQPAPVPTGAGLFSAAYHLPPELRRRVAHERVALVDDVISAGSSVRATLTKLTAAEATTVLRFAPQGASEPVLKVLESAIANARVKADKTAERFDERELVVAAAYVDEGPTMKRFRPRAQGRASRINKRTSHITVVVAPQVAKNGGKG